MLSGTWSVSWGWPAQSQELDFDDYCGCLPTQDISQLYNEQKLGLCDYLFLKTASHPPPSSGNTAIKLTTAPWSIYSELWTVDAKISVQFPIPSLSLHRKLSRDAFSNPVRCCFSSPIQDWAETGRAAKQLHNCNKCNWLIPSENFSLYYFLKPEPKSCVFCFIFRILKYVHENFLTRADFHYKWF